MVTGAPPNPVLGVDPERWHALRRPRHLARSPQSPRDPLSVAGRDGLGRPRHAPGADQPHRHRPLRTPARIPAGLGVGLPPRQIHRALHAFPHLASIRSAKSPAASAAAPRRRCWPCCAIPSSTCWRPSTHEVSSKPSNTCKFTPPAPKNLSGSRSANIGKTLERPVLRLS